MAAETGGCHKHSEVSAEGTAGGVSHGSRGLPAGRASSVSRRGPDTGTPESPTSSARQEVYDQAHSSPVARYAASPADDAVPSAVGNKLADAPTVVINNTELISDVGMPFKRWSPSPSASIGLAESYGAYPRPVFGSLGSTTSTDSASTIFSPIVEAQELDFELPFHRRSQYFPEMNADRSKAHFERELGISGLGSNKTTMAAFDVLPVEIKGRVFSYLKPEDLVRVSRVSRSWYTAAYDGALWSRLDLRGFYSKISKDKIEQLLTSGGEFLRSANLRGCSHLTSSTLRRMAGACPNLVELDLEGCHSVSSRGLARLLSGLRKLRKFHAAGLTAVTDEVLELLTVATRDGGPPALESLIITRCRKVTAAGILRVANALPSLSTLNIGGCRDLDDAALEAIGSSSCAPQLRHLSLAWCVSVTDAGIIRLVAGAVPSLTSALLELAPTVDSPRMSLMSLDLTGCVQVGDLGVSALSSASPNLRFLDLEDCRRITDASLKALADNNPRLEVLGLAHCEGVTDGGISLVLAACNLRRLSLDCCPLITSATLRRIVELAHDCTAPASESSATTGPTVGPVALSLYPAGHDPGSVKTASKSSFQLRELEINDCIAVSPSYVSEAITKVPSLQVRCFYTWQARAEEESRRMRTAGTAGDGGASVALSEGESERDTTLQGRHGHRNGICNIL